MPDAGADMACCSIGLWKESPSCHSRFSSISGAGRFSQERSAPQIIIVPGENCVLNTSVFPFIAPYAAKQAMQVRCIVVQYMGTKRRELNSGECWKWVKVAHGPKP